MKIDIERIILEVRDRDFSINGDEVDIEDFIRKNTGDPYLLGLTAGQLWSILKLQIGESLMLAGGVSEEFVLKRDG